METDYDILHGKNDKMFFFTQVETVGDKYMTVSGLPEPCTHHAKSICHLALDMMEIAGQVKVDDEPVQVWYECQMILNSHVQKHCAKPSC